MNKNLDHSVSCVHLNEKLNLIIHRVKHFGQKTSKTVTEIGQVMMFFVGIKKWKIDFD